MRKKLAPDPLHDGEAFELASKTTSLGLPKHVSFRERYTSQTKYNRRPRTDPE